MKITKIRFLTALLAVILMCGIVPQRIFCAEADKTYYIDPVKGNDSRAGTKSRPVKTVGKALTLAYDYFSNNAESSVVLCLKDGEYRISDTIEINEQNLNGGSLVFRADENAEPVISGGKKISGWELYDAQKNIYSAPLSDANPRQLYVNGKRATRARTEDNYLREELSYVKADGKYIGYSSSSAVPLEWTNTSAIEFVYSSEWANHRCRVSSVDAEQNGALIRMANGFDGLCTISWGTHITKENATYYLENAYEFLDTEREFYVDTAAGRVFYKPSADENMETAEIVYPSVTTLIKLKNLVVWRKVANIRFENISFMYSAWQSPNEYDVYFDNQNNIDIWGRTAAAAIYIEGAENITFEGCTVRNTGGDGIQLKRGIKGCRLNNCEIYDTAAGAVTFGSVEEADILGTDSNAAVCGSSIQNCKIYNTGLDYRGAAAITLGAVSNMTVHHNEIYNTSYSGMHIGWGWNNYADKQVAAKNISVKYNYLHDIMISTVTDGGAIYTLGKNSGGCVTAYNYIKNQYRKASCLYNDEGTNDWVSHHNVVDNSAVTTWTPIWMHWHKDTIVRCHMYDNYADSDYVYRNSPTCVMERLTVVSDGSWPEEAVSIMNHAGVGKEDIAEVKEFYGQKANDGEELFKTGGFDSRELQTDGWILNGNYSYELEGSLDNTCGGSSGSVKITAEESGSVLAKEVSLRRNSYYHFSAMIKPEKAENLYITVTPYMQYNGERTYLAQQQAYGGKWTEIQAYFQSAVREDTVDYQTAELYDKYIIGFEMSAVGNNTVYADEVNLYRYNAYYNTSFENSFEGWSIVGDNTAELVSFDPDRDGVARLVENGEFPDTARVARFSSDSALTAGICQNFAFERNTVYDVSYWIKTDESDKKIATVAYPLGENKAFSEAWPYAIWAKTDLSAGKWTHIRYQIVFGNSEEAKAFDSRLEIRYANASEAGENPVPGSFYMAEFKVEKTGNIIGNPYFLLGSAATRSEDDKDWSKNIASSLHWNNEGLTVLNNMEAEAFDGAKACASFTASGESCSFGQTVQAAKAGNYGLSVWVKTDAEASLALDGQRLTTQAVSYNGWKKLTAACELDSISSHRIEVILDSEGECLFKDFEARPLSNDARLGKFSVLDGESALVADCSGVYADMPHSGVKIRGRLENTAGVQLAAAGYSSDGTLLFAETEQADTDVFEKTMLANSAQKAEYVKIFAWSSLEKILPFEKAIIIEG